MSKWIVQSEHPGWQPAASGVYWRRSPDAGLLMATSPKDSTEHVITYVRDLIASGDFALATGSPPSGNSRPSLA